MKTNGQGFPAGREPSQFGRPALDTPVAVQVRSKPYSGGKRRAR